MFLLDMKHIISYHVMPTNRTIAMLSKQTRAFMLPVSYNIIISIKYVLVPVFYMILFNVMCVMLNVKTAVFCALLFMDNELPHVNRTTRTI